jgi:23S rRNA (uracil1939-C5)-methyltransferase
MELTVRALKPVYGGYTLARAEGTLFVRGALPGELVSVAVRERKKDYAVADVVAVREASPDRVEAPCPVYGTCGGCQVQHAAYPRQLELKAEVLRDVLRRIGRMEAEPAPVEGSDPFRYRYRGQFKAGGGRIGFFRMSSRDLVAIKGCPLMIDPINERLEGMARVAGEAGAGEVYASSDGTKVVAYLKGTAFDPALSGPGLAGLVFEDGVRGEGELSLRIGEDSYAVSAKGFFQANWRLNLRLVDRVLQLAGACPDCRVLDLYAGAGNFSIPLARRSREVVAVEEGADSARSLQGNVDRNGLRNVKAVHARVERFRPRGRFDVVVADPPRAGLSEKAFRLVRACAAPLFLYVSCEPPTLARDLAKLSALYEVKSLEPYDFFPNTFHIETLAVLARRDD